MSIFDYLRTEYIKGTVKDKYRLENGNIGVVVERAGTKMRYHVEFRDDHRKRSYENLYGLLRTPYADRMDHLDHLIEEGDCIEMRTSYSQDPIREGFRIYSVSKPREYSRIPQNNVVNLPYTSQQGHGY